MRMVYFTKVSIHMVGREARLCSRSLRMACPQMTLKTLSPGQLQASLSSLLAPPATRITQNLLGRRWSCLWWMSAVEGMQSKAPVCVGLTPKSCGYSIATKRFPDSWHLLLLFSGLHKDETHKQMDPTWSPQRLCCKQRLFCKHA